MAVSEYTSARAHCLDRLSKIGDRDRLVQEWSLQTGEETLRSLVWLSAGAEHDPRHHLWPKLEELREKRRPVQLRHPDVADDGIHAQPTEHHAQSFGTIPGRHHLVIRLEHPPECAQHGGI